MTFSPFFSISFIKAVLSKCRDASENTDSQLAFVGAEKKRGVLSLHLYNPSVSRVGSPAPNYESGSQTGITKPRLSVCPSADSWVFQGGAWSSLISHLREERPQEALCFALFHTTILADLGLSRYRHLL